MNKREIFIGLAGACLGALVGILLVSKRYEERLKEEVELTEKLIAEINRKETSEDVYDITSEEPTEVEIVDNILDYSNYRPKKTYTEEIIVSGEQSYNDKIDPSTISPPEGIDYASEPYVISFEEFCDGVQGFGQETITYYAGDDTLADFNEDIIDDRSGVIGDEALTNFGKGSDPDVVYVRNESLSCDYDIVRDHRKYKEVVCGMMEE